MQSYKIIVYFFCESDGSLDQGVEPNPNLNREPVKPAFFRWTRTEPESFKFEITEPEPNPNL